MEEWKEYKLEDTSIEMIDGDRGKNYPKNNDFLSDGYCLFLNAGNVTKDGFSFSDKSFITQEKDDELRKGRLEKYDVVITTRGTVGNVALYDNKVPFEHIRINSGMLILKSGKDILSEYLYYYLKGKKFQSQISLFVSGSAQPQLPKSTLGKMSISYPNNKDTQNKIVSILKSLDDKIEVNRKINENLEQQAQALFKSWFVDFEPFKKGEFVESELGMIPKGWRVGRYDDIIESTISGDWGKEKPEGNYTHRVACIRGCDFQDIKNGLRGKTPERYILEKNFLTKHFKDKDVLVEISGGTATVSTGRVCPVSQLLIDKFNEDIVCTNFCRLVRPKPSYGAYLYYSWLYKFNNKVMFGYENGTSGIKNFRIKDFTSLDPIVIPSESSLQLFQSMIDKLQMKLQMNGSESQKLASLRDTLLPRLMSGELNVFDKPNDQS